MLLPLLPRPAPAAPAGPSGRPPTMTPGRPTGGCWAPAAAAAARPAPVDAAPAPGAASPCCLDHACSSSCSLSEPDACGCVAAAPSARCTPNGPCCRPLPAVLPCPCPAQTLSGPAAPSGPLPAAALISRLAWPRPIGGVLPPWPPGRLRVAGPGTTDARGGSPGCRELCREPCSAPNCCLLVLLLVLPPPAAGSAQPAGCNPHSMPDSGKLSGCSAAPAAAGACNSRRVGLAGVVASGAAPAASASPVKSLTKLRGHRPGWGAAGSPC